MSIARSRLVHLSFPDMRLRFAWVTLLFITLLIAAAPAIDEVPVFQAIRDSVTELQTALHRKVASILIAKVADKVAGTSYESTWQVTVRYYLDYSTPEDVPYLRGMRKCLAESGPTAGKEWVTWAESQIRLIREGYAEEIAFQQELRMAVTVTASLDPSGGLVASSVEASHAVSDSVMVTFRAEILAAPSDSQIQEAGYNFLKDRAPSEARPSSWSTHEQKETPSAPSTPSQGSSRTASRCRRLAETLKRAALALSSRSVLADWQSWWCYSCLISGCCIGVGAERFLSG